MNLANIKWIAIIIGLCALVYFTKDYIDKTQFKKDSEANELANQRFDSLRISYIKLSDTQMMSTLKEKEQYKKLLKENNIKLSRVTSIMNSILKYRDTTVVNTDLSPILDAINLNKNYTHTFKDSTACLVTKGSIDYINGSLSLNITDRQFNNEITAFGHLERNEWKFLWFKTRLFGKWKGTATVIDKCGESKTIIIQKQK